MTEFVPERDATGDFTSQIPDTLGSPIATGSFGDVYRLTLQSGEGATEVAVKVFKVDPTTVDKVSKAISRELKVWLRLKHPRIVPLLGTARVKSPLLALVSRWMPSGTLYEYLDVQATTIAPSARIKLVEDIAEGLAYLHSENVIHGDLHPGNVLIDSSGNPSLADFGLATVAGDPELQWTTMTLECCFSPRWRAPEVIGIRSKPERPAFKSDIYSFGSVMFFIVSGDIPWKEKKHSYLIPIKLSQGAIPMRPHNILDDHWDLIRKCWSLEMSDRPEATSVLHAVANCPQKFVCNQNLDLDPYSTMVTQGFSDRYASSPYSIPEFHWQYTAPLERRADSISTELHPSISTKNIVIFGGRGVGKSSVVNLMAGQRIAKMSPDTKHNPQLGDHTIKFDGHRYKVFETAGLERTRLGMKEYLNIIVDMHNLIAKLDNEGGIDLLIFCARASKDITILQTNYRIFYTWLCESKVPIILVLTGLEREQNMEDWWTRHQQQYDIRVDGHACITTASRLDRRQQGLYEESRRLVRELVTKHIEGNAYTGGKTWFGRVVGKLWGLPGDFEFAPKGKDIETVLINRYGMPPEAARKLASKIRSGIPRRISFSSLALRRVVPSYPMV